MGIYVTNLKFVGLLRNAMQAWGVEACTGLNTRLVVDVYSPP